MTEKELEQKLVRSAKARGGIAYKFVSPGHNGVPDRIITLPFGKVGFIEVKRPNGGKLSPLQKNELERLRNLGFKAYVLNNEGDIEKLLDEIQST